MKTLIIEDNIKYVELIKDSLNNISKTIEVANDGVEGLYMAESEAYDLILLDVMLPKMGGVEVLKKIREKSICPVIVISALTEVEKRVEMLNLGADDYIVKPYNNDEFIARIKAVMRRYNNNFYEIYKFEDITLDYRRKMFCVGGTYIKLSGKTYDVLEYLIRNRNIIVPKEQLFNNLWGTDCDTVITVTEVYVCKLRNILKKYNVEKYLRTIKNIGYMWEEK